MFIEVRPVLLKASETLNLASRNDFGDLTLWLSLERRVVLLLSRTVGLVYLIKACMAGRPIYKHAIMSMPIRGMRKGAQKKAAIKESELCMDPGKTKVLTNARQILALLSKDGSLRKYS